MSFSSESEKSLFKSNVSANLIGRFSSVALALICTPIYIRSLGMEAYGLIGFYLTLQASIQFLEMGLGRACNRELAINSTLGERGARQSRVTLRSLESVYWLLAILIGIGLTLAIPWIVQYWLNDSSFDNERIEYLLYIISWVIALRWPAGLYHGALSGLQQQVLLNVLLVGFSILNWVGSVLVLEFVESDIEYFFKWQILIGVLSTIVLRSVAWSRMPRAYDFVTCFSWERIRELFSFAAGVGGNAVLGTILRQMDKLIVSAIFPLDVLGYYVLATLIAGVVASLVEPIYNAVYPRLSQMIGDNKAEATISDLYLFASQLSSALIIPAGMMLVIFAPEVLFAYTGNSEMAKQAASVLAILALAKMLHAEMMIPYALQLASGWVRLSLYTNIVSVIWIVPAVYVFGNLFGPTGVATAWLVVTCGYVLIGLPLMHRRLLVGKWKDWFISAILRPVITAGSSLMLAKWLLYDVGIINTGSRWYLVIFLCLSGFISFVLAFLSMPAIRARILSNRIWGEV